MHIESSLMIHTICIASMQEHSKEYAKKRLNCDHATFTTSIMGGMGGRGGGGGGGGTQ